MAYHVRPLHSLIGHCSLWCLVILPRHFILGAWVPLYPIIYTRVLSDTPQIRWRPFFALGLKMCNDVIFTVFILSANIIITYLQYGSKNFIIYRATTYITFVILLIYLKKLPTYFILNYSKLANFN